MSKPKQTQDPAEAFLNMSRDYHRAANLLAKVDDCPHSPLYFLFAHAIELALKAFIRTRGKPVDQIHDLAALLNECQTCGLQVTVDLKNVVGLLQTENESSGLRYFLFKNTGSPEIRYLVETADNLMTAVAKEVSQRPTQNLPGGAVVKMTVSKPTKRQSTA